MLKIEVLQAMQEGEPQPRTGRRLTNSDLLEIRRTFRKQNKLWYRLWGTDVNPSWFKVCVEVFLVWIAPILVFFGILRLI